VICLCHIHMHPAYAIRPSAEKMMPQLIEPISIHVQWGDLGILPMVASDVLSNLLAVPGPECEISSVGIRKIHRHNDHLSRPRLLLS